MAKYVKSSNKRYQKSRRPKKKLSKVDQLVVNAQKSINKKLEDNNKKMAEGVAVHTIVNRRTSSNLLSNINDYTDPNLEDRDSVVTLARQLRNVEGVCSTVGDLLVDFAASKGIFYCDNDELKSLLNSWAKRVNAYGHDVTKKTTVKPIPGLRQVARKIIDDYLTDGDAVVTLKWEKMQVTADGQPVYVPIEIRVLDTTSLSIDEDLAKLGVELIEMKIDDKVVKRLTSPENDLDRMASKLIPKEWLQQLRKGEPIVLDPNVTYHFKRNAKDYKAWGVPLYLKAFGAVANKRRIQAVDEATIDGLINRFTVFKLGLPDREKNPAYHVPTGARVESLIGLLTSPKRTNAFVWPGPDLEIEDIGPDGKILEFDKKYTQADIDILRALHVSELLINGQSAGQQGRDWAAFISTEVGLDAVRNELENILTQVAEEIALTNKMAYETLLFKFDPLSLKDSEMLRKFAIDVYKLGGISTETFVKVQGYNFDIEKATKTKEKEEGIDEIFINQFFPGTSFPDKDKGGRPDDTKEEDKTTVDEPAKPDTKKDTSKASKRSVDFYISQYETLFIDMVLKAQKYAGTDIARVSVIGALTRFRKSITAHMTETYLKQTGGNSPEVIESLKHWNRGYLDRFVLEILDAFDKNPDQFEQYITSNINRIKQYATEVYSKAYWVGQVEMHRIQRFTHVVWQCTNEDSPCMAHNNQVYEIDEIMGVFPGHVGCQCTLKFVKLTEEH